MVAIANGPLFVAALVAILACEASPAGRPCQDAAGRAVALCPAVWGPLPGRRTGRRSRAARRSTTHRPPGRRLPTRCRSIGARSGLGDHAPLGPELRGVPLHPTSGSTGLPKIALRPGLAAMEEARHYAETMSIDADDAILAIPPMSHAYGYGMCVMVPLLTGASIVSMRRFSAKAVQRAHGRASADHRADGAGHARRHVVRRRRRHATAAVGVGGRRHAAAALGRTIPSPDRAVATPLYGTTETGGISVATSRPADATSTAGSARRWPVSKSPSVRDGDAEPGRRTWAGCMVRSSSQMNAYLDERGELSQAADDGWFDTGDLAQIDRRRHDSPARPRQRGDQRLGAESRPLRSRRDDRQLAGVLEVKVYAGQHRSGSQMVKAAVAAESGLSVADIRAHCERQLVYYKRPQVVTLVDALPRNPAGKIIRDQLP